LKASVIPRMAYQGEECKLETSAILEVNGSTDILDRTS